MSIQEQVEHETDGFLEMAPLLRFATSLIDTLTIVSEAVRREGESLQGDVSLCRARASAALLLRRADTLDQLVRDLSRFCSVNVVKPRIIALPTFLETASDLLAKLAKPHSLCIQCSEGLPSIVADPFELETVLFSLVSIPRKRMSSDSSIIINVRKSAASTFPNMAQRIKLQFDYIGLKLAPDEIARLFEPWLTRNRFGISLGLCTVYGTLRRMNGQLFTSQQPSGLRLVIRLPGSDSP